MSLFFVYFFELEVLQYKISKGYVCVYEFDEAALHNLKTLVFNAPTDEWVDFVMQNRTQKGFVHEYDLVYGPEALYQDFKAEIL